MGDPYPEWETWPAWPLDWRFFAEQIGGFLFTETPLVASPTPSIPEEWGSMLYPTPSTPTLFFGPADQSPPDLYALGYCTDSEFVSDDEAEGSGAGEGEGE